MRPTWNSLAIFVLLAVFAKSIEAHPGDRLRQLKAALGPTALAQLRGFTGNSQPAAQRALRESLERGALTPVDLGSDRAGFLFTPAWRPPQLVVAPSAAGLDFVPALNPPIRVHLSVRLSPGKAGLVIADFEAILTSNGPWPAEVLLALPPDFAPRESDLAGFTRRHSLGLVSVERTDASPLVLRARRQLSPKDPGPYDLVAQIPLPMGGPQGSASLQLDTANISVLRFGFPKSPGGVAGSSKAHVPLQAGGPLCGFFLLPKPAEIIPTTSPATVEILAAPAGTATIFALQVRRILPSMTRRLGPLAGQVLLLTEGEDTPLWGATMGGIAALRLPAESSHSGPSLAVLAHEVAHLAVDGPSLGPAPDALREGMANLLALEVLQDDPQDLPAFRHLRGSISRALLGMSRSVAGSPRNQRPGDDHGSLRQLTAYALQPAALRAYSRVLTPAKFWAAYQGYLASLSDRGPDVPGWLGYLRDPSSGIPDDRALRQLHRDFQEVMSAKRRQELALQLYSP